MTSGACVECRVVFEYSDEGRYTSPPNRCRACRVARQARLVTIAATVHIDAVTLALGDDGKEYYLPVGVAVGFLLCPGARVFITVDPQSFRREPGRRPMAIAMREADPSQTKAPVRWPARCPTCSWERRLASWRQARDAEKAHASSHAEARAG